MHLDMCFPREIAEAKKNHTPVVIVGGTVEYHGPQCSYGCDTLIAQGLVEKLAERKELIIAPTISYSPSSYAVGDATSGTVHVEENAFEEYVYYVFMSMLSAGLRNIYVVIHHQFEQESLMPMTLCYMKAAKRATMQYLENAPSVYERVQRTVLDIQTDMEYPNALRPEDNPGYGTDYKW